MKFVELKKEENVMIMFMNHKENNAFAPTFIEELHLALDDVESNSEIDALVVTGGSEKFFCTGLDLEDMEWISKGNDAILNFMSSMNSLFKRVLLFPMLTISCINGHAYAGGVILAFLMDYRFMRQDRGFLRCPEVTININFPYSMVKVIEKVVSPVVARDMILVGKKYDGNEALKVGAVDGIFTKEELLPQAVKFAKEKSAQLTKRAFISIKQSMYGELAKILDKENWQGFPFG